MTDEIKNIIDKFELGYVFTVTDFPMTAENPKTVRKILNHFVATGYLRKLSKGRFYKLQISRFGELPPDTYQIVKDLIQKDGKLIGYITGYSAFNDFALTTQFSAILEIGMRKEKKAIVRGIYRIRFIQQENTITKENILDTTPDNKVPARTQNRLNVMRKLRTPLRFSRERTVSGALQITLAVSDSVKSTN
ncbi:MAG: DUF6088 family protein [Fibrobacter sp.]|jgi:predicted transcriptional regulator of viral defense system|nr:DUF6088 family protein [Fibrobacter sp.]